MGLPVEKRVCIVNAYNKNALARQELVLCTCTIYNWTNSFPLTKTTRCLRLLLYLSPDHMLEEDRHDRNAKTRSTHEKYFHQLPLSFEILTYHEGAGVPSHANTHS